MVTVDSDVILTKLSSCGAGKMFNRSLRRAIGNAGELLNPTGSCYGSGVYDAAAPLLHHCGKDSLSAEESTEDVHTHDEIPELSRRLREWAG